MRPLPAALLLLAACHATVADATLPSGWRPTGPVATRLPPGSVLRTEVAKGLPDEPPWRAAAVWWREALRQTATFEVREGAGARSTALVLQMAVDPTTRSVAAFLRHDDHEQALAGDSFADGDLPAAIDRLAWAARAALGEQAAAPVPVAACVSADPLVALAVDDAMTLLHDGAAGGAHRALVDARARDGAAPMVLDGLAAVELLRGNAAAAERLCREALGYGNRLQPTTEHRLARTLLLAKSSLHPESAARHDRELQALGEAGLRERPHDAEMQLTLALAHNFLGEFATSRPLLEHLHERLPDEPIVSYHLGWACLGTGDGPAAVRHFDAAALRLPMPWVALPRAIAHFAAGDDEGLQRLIDGFQAELRDDGDPLVHEIRRMQAAHAVLRGDTAQARAFILQDLNWLVRNPASLERRAGEFAEQAAVLVRLGGSEGLPSLLAALQGQHPATPVADACAYVAGLVEVATHRRRALASEANLARGGESAWSVLLAAFAHELCGEVLDMQNALARAARLDGSPMTKALLARSLRAAGKVTEAEALQSALRREMLAIHLRRTPQHPLLGPELAFAFRAD